MKCKKRIYTYFFLIVVMLLSINVNMTSAKYFSETFGIAWENYFTTFAQLKSVFYIKNNNGETDDRLWGGTKSGSTAAGTISQHPDGSDFFTFGSFPEGGITRYEEKTKDEIKDSYGDYFIEKLKNIELNVVNQSEQRMVIIFKIYYYAPKFENVSTHISFGVYNTILSSNNNEKMIKGEICVNQGSDDYTTGQYDDIIEVSSIRLSGNSGGQFNTDTSLGGVFASGDFYYPHRLDINPYQILYDSKKYDIITESYHTDEKDNGGNPVSYKYPAQDKHNSEVEYAHNLMNKVDLEDFILDVNESGSFNLSLYFGNITNFLNNPELSDAQTNSVSFVTSLSIEAIPESKILEEIKNLGGTV